MNKRGQIGDYATFIVMLFVIAVVFLVVWYTLGKMNLAWNSQPNLDAHAVAMNNEVFGDFGKTMDNMFVLMFIGTLLGGLVLSYVLQSNPGMFFVLMLVVFLMSIVAGYFGNAYTDVAGDSQLEGAAESLTAIAFVMDNYLLLTFINITLMTIVFFAKPNTGLSA